LNVDNSYELRITGLKLGIHRYDWVIDERFLVERGVEHFSTARLLVDLEVEKKERLMNLTFTIDGDLTTVCDRCGEAVTIDLGTEDHLVVKFAHETDLTDDEVVFIDENDHQFDVSQFIYEFIVVGLPSRLVHSEGACNPEVMKYLEESSEEDLKKEEEKDIDPRWEALKNLKP
jgi:uncharacterized protein